jgi:hypothetical protein
MTPVDGESPPTTFAWSGLFKKEAAKICIAVDRVLAGEVHLNLADVSMAMKKCTACGESKPKASGFYKSSGRVCRECSHEGVAIHKSGSC